VSARFDVTHSTIIGLPMNGAKSSVKWSHTEITRVQAQSKSVLAGVASAFVNMFSNGGARVSLQNLINVPNTQMKKQIESRLARLDALVAGLRSQGYTKLTSQVQNGQLVLTAIKEILPNANANAMVQPLNTHLSAMRALSKTSPADRVGLNPQPLPPRDAKSVLVR
jgi:hypothetical protein